MGGETGKSVLMPALQFPVLYGRIQNSDEF